MKRFKVCIGILLLLFFLSLPSCSKVGEEKEKGAIDKMTEDAAEKILAPIKQAEAAKTLEDSRVKRVDDALEEYK